MTARHKYGMKLYDHFYTELMISFDEIKDVERGGGSSYFPIMCNYFMKLYKRFQMKLMVSFDEI